MIPHQTPSKANPNLLIVTKAEMQQARIPKNNVIQIHQTNDLLRELWRKSQQQH